MKKIILLGILAILSSGCASAVLKSGCGHVNGSHVTIPYVGGTADGNAYGCYMVYSSLKGKGPDPDTLSTNLAAITAEYIKDATKDNQITTAGPSVITVSPVTK